MERFEELERLFRRYDFKDYRWLDPADIVVRQWVRFKCLFACSHYGEKAVCPPNMPPVEECREFFSEYRDAAVIRIEKPYPLAGENPEEFGDIAERLLKLESALFLEGYYKVLMFPMNTCFFCPECAGVDTECFHRESSRPTPEALGVDVFETVRKLGYPVEVLTEDSEMMNRYAFILIR